MRYKPKYPLSVDIPEYHISDAEKKSNAIVHQLSIMGYDVCFERDVVKFIEKRGVDKFNFDYPYGSFEEYKKHVLAGEFDVDAESFEMTKEQHKQFLKWEKEGRITYERL